MVEHRLRAYQIDAHDIFQVTCFESFFNKLLGGREHLAKKIGEYSRGVRILKAFDSCPSLLDLAWYLRGCGALDEALSLMRDVHPIWCGPILCLKGLLVRVAQGKFWTPPRVVAGFLMGDCEPGDVGWGEAMVLSEMEVMAGKRIGEPKFKDLATAGPEGMRFLLAAAESARIEGDLNKAERLMEDALPWILRGSVEHLCVLHLIRSRIRADRNDWSGSLQSTEEGLLLARKGGYGIYHIDLLNQRAAVLLRMSSPSATLDLPMTYALQALHGVAFSRPESPAAAPDQPLENLLSIGSLHPECRYAWGTTEAYALMGEIALKQQDHARARRQFRLALDLGRGLSQRRRAALNSLL